MTPGAPDCTVAIDFSQLDHLQPGAGQFRYVSELVRGLAGLDDAPDLLVLGSRDAPVTALADLFDRADRSPRYRRIAPLGWRGLGYLDHLRYRALLRREGVGLLHATHSFIPIPPPCPVVATIYDLMYELFPEYAPARRARAYRLHRWAVRRVVRRAICISATTARDLERLWHVAPSSIDVVMLGTDLGTWDGETPERDGPTARLLSPYNLEPRKNLATLLEAVAMLRGRGTDARLTLFGRAAVSDDRERHFEKTVRALGISAAIERTGIVSDAELARLYRTAAVFVFPSLYEGFGLPVLEAMASGACVVARKASAMAEVVGDAGLLVETADAGQLAGALAGLLADAAERRRLGEAARGRAREFTIARMATQTMRSYRAALAAAGRAR